MRIPRIYTAISLSENSLIELDTDSSHYVSKVLRLREGDQLSVFNPDDGEYAAQINTISRKTVQLQLSAAICSYSLLFTAIYYCFTAILLCFRIFPGAELLFITVNFGDTSHTECMFRVSELWPRDSFRDTS